MYFGTNSGDRVSGYDRKLKSNDLVFTFRKGEENKRQCTTGPTATTVQSSKQLIKNSGPRFRR